MSFGKNHKINNTNDLSSTIQDLGTTFIKLGQFLATRPDIIGEEMAKDLEKLQDKVPAFELYEAKKVIKKLLERHPLRQKIHDNYKGEDV